MRGIGLGTPHMLNQQAMIYLSRNIRIDKMISWVEEGVKLAKSVTGPLF